MCVPLLIQALLGAQLRLADLSRVLAKMDLSDNLLSLEDLSRRYDAQVLRECPPFHETFDGVLVHGSRATF